MIIIQTTNTQTHKHTNTPNTQTKQTYLRMFQAELCANVSVEYAVENNGQTQDEVES